jgi:hypothetical protein
MKRSILFSFVFLFLLTAFAAYGEESLIVNVPFAFTAADKQLPAGKYDVTFQATVPDDLVLRNAKGDMEMNVPVITRLAQRADLTKKEDSMVFDEVGNKKVLSEVWLPDFDGFLTSATKEPHTHKIIRPAK